MIDIDKAIAAAVKTGKVSFGTNAALQKREIGKAKMIVLASNCPKDIKEDIEYYSKSQESRYCLQRCFDGFG